MASLKMLRRSSYCNWVSRPTFQRKASPSALEPWLMIKDGDAVGPDPDAAGFYKFYSLADEQDVSACARDGIVVGSSRGWLAMYKRQLDSSMRIRGFEMFLYNPVHRRRIDLPLAETMPIRNYTSRLSPIGKFFEPKKVIISGSPTYDSCRAIMSFGQDDRLACCCPKRSMRWTPMFETRSSYEDFVYSTGRKQLFCTTKCGNFESWDLGDPHSPRLNWKINDYAEPIEKQGDDSCWKKYLVFAERSNRLFHVRRSIVGFDVYEVILFDDDDLMKGVELRYMDRGSLDGMAFFVGSPGHGFVIEKDEMVKNVEPDSIYYTDPEQLDPCVFNYKKKTFSTCYCPPPDDIRSDERAAPVWFTPSLVYHSHDIFG